MRELHYDAQETERALCRSGERIDDLQRNGLRILQDPARFCFGMDAVLLSAYVQMKKARRGLDLGTGNGIIPILLSDRTDCAHLTGLEIQPASADLAARSVALNGLADRISIVQGDLREADHYYGAASFDMITCNPPYRKIGSGKISGDQTVSAETARKEAGSGKIAGKHTVSAETARKEAGSGKISGKHTASAETVRKEAESGKVTEKHDHSGENFRTGDAYITAESSTEAEAFDPRAIARHEILCTFEDVARVAARLLRPGGHFYLVHRPLRLAEIMTQLCAAGLEPKRMRLVYPHVDEAPNMVLLDCVRGGASELRVEPPLIVYDQAGNYTPELLEIYYGD